MHLYALDAFTGDVVWCVPYAGSSPVLKGQGPFLNALSFTGSSGVTISIDDVEFSGFGITRTEDLRYGMIEGNCFWFKDFRTFE